MNQLKEYIIALTNLYGAVHKEKVQEIYNNQNKDKVNLGLIEAMLKNPPVDLEAFAVYTEGAYFIHEAIFMIDNLEEMLKKKKGKPYYVPNKEELLHYIDEEYFEKTREYKALLKYVKKNFLKNQPEKAEELCEEIHKILHIGPDMQEVMNTLNYRGIDFKDMDQLNELTGLLMELANNIRIWENNGHTPREIFEKFEKPDMKPLPIESIKAHKKNEKDRTPVKNVGRNEPCPCGSGKKYKKCCGRNENVISLFGEEITPEEALEVRRLFEIYSEPKVAEIMGQMHRKFQTDHLPRPNQKNAEYLIAEWVIMEYPYEDDKSLFDLFLMDMEGKMDRRLLRKLDSWQKTYLSAYEVIDEQGGKEILVRDIFTHEEKVISVALVENPATIGDMKVTRLVPVAGVYEYFFGSFYLPLEFKDVMVRLLERFKEEHKKTWEKFLKENGDLLIQLVAETFREDEETDQVPENPGGDFEIPDFMPEDMEVVESILKLDWKKDIYRQEAKLFVEKTRGTYLPEDIISGLYMWWDYTSLETPNFRKPGVWAAAINELIDELSEYYYYGSRSEIANVYGISLSSLSMNYRRLVDFFQALQPDKRGFREDQVPENLPKKKITPDVERSIQKLKGILESGGRKASLEDLENDPTGDAMPSGKTNAQDLIYDAWEAVSPKQKIRLAKKALEIDPASADAYVLLVQYQATSPEEAMSYYQKGIEAGEKALGKAFFKENEGDFWGILETRPYMRAKMGLGQTLLENKAYAEAAEVFEDMLRLNPNDNQGARSLLVLAYFMEKDYSKAKALLDDYDEDFLSDWSYNKSLQVFAEEGESKEAKRRLKNAVKKNPHVPKYLLGEKRLPENLPDAYSLGGEEEAVIYAIYGKKAWSKTPGALAWLYNSILK